MTNKLEKTYKSLVIEKLSTGYVVTDNCGEPGRSRSYDQLGAFSTLAEALEYIQAHILRDDAGKDRVRT
jgi:hypothetical protein